MLTASELRFSAEEVRQWAAPLDADALALMQWHERCHGWALGIARALQARRRDSDYPVRAFETAKQELFAYFGAEVFEHATPCERRVMVSCALVARTSGQVAEALSGNTEAHDVLARIAERHEFTTRAPGALPAYQFMPLFREFLLTRISDTFSPAELRALATRATALVEKDLHQNSLGDCELLKAYLALRCGVGTSCQQLLSTTLTEADCARKAAQASAVFLTSVGQPCGHEQREAIAPDSARQPFERHGLPPPRAGRHWPQPFKVYVLGRFRLLKADTPVRFSRRVQRKPLELLQALIAFGATDVPARTLIDALWPHSEGDAGYHALESTLYRLRQMLGASDAVRMVTRRLTLDHSQFWVDMW